MAEFLHLLADAFDYSQLTEDVLKDISSKEFSATDLKGPKSISSFLIRISELTPNLVIKQMTLLANLLDSESYTLRCALIEVCGNLIAMLSKLSQDDRSENHKAQIRIFFEVLEDRFMDINPYCRCRVMQVYVKLCDSNQTKNKRRLKVAELAARSLEDKSSNVRRNAIKLLSKLVATHPYTQFDAGLLSTKDWTKRLEDVDDRISALQPPEELREHAPGEQTVDESLLQDATQAEMVDAPNHPSEMTEEERAAALEKVQKDAATLQELETQQVIRKLVVEALTFAEIIDEAAETVTHLLSSKNKSEVIEAMDFFVTAHAYAVLNAKLGIRRMLRLIWTKGNSDEGKGVQAHLLECYKGLYFDAPPLINANAVANYVCNGMISLTFGTTPAELTSLEQLLSTMMKQGLVNALVIQKLWQVYGYQKKDSSKNQRRGAIIVLGMLALSSPDIVVQEMEVCLRIGLGELGRRDLSLARYTCIALRRMSPPPGKQAADTVPRQVVKLPNDHAVLVRLAAVTEIVTDSKEWYGVAEQAIAAIYVLSKHPDVLCSEIIRRVTKRVFAAQSPPRPTTSSSAGEDTHMAGTSDDDEPAEPAEPAEPTEPVVEQVQPKKQNSALALAQLLFIVGHIAIKQIVHLELCELEFKRRKAEKDKTTAQTPRKSMTPVEPTPLKKGRKRGATKEPTPAPEEAADELDLMAGTNEEEFTEAIAHVRERELLFGPQSLLAKFGQMVADICSNNTSYNHPTLQAQAALCLAKLMCVSSEYCENNLGLLLTILERSQDAVVRSNLVVALGDMAVCFNHLIDENTDFLYRRLNDGDPSVKRTCLMTLTFLILAGQVKVKGQLGEMAKCLEDSDKKIADMARMFFSELATKDNAVYNQFVDMFSVLSADSALDVDAFKRIIKFLAGFIEKVGPTINSRYRTCNWLTKYRTNTRNNCPSNSPPGYHEQRTRGSGTTWRTRSAYSNTKTKRYRNRSRRVSRRCRRLPKGGAGYGAMLLRLDMLGL
jgi:condensin complex subunit 1